MWESILKFVLPKARGEYYQRPMPHELKQKALLEYAQKYQLKTFIETGTYMGETVAVMKEHFDKVISIELAHELFLKAKEMFKDDRNVEILEGDSGELLKSVVTNLDTPAMFWLDGHYSFGNTARGDKDTPILEELGTILQHQIKDHVIFIDDARCFNGTYFYPTEAEIFTAVAKAGNNYQVKIWNDIFRITPR